MNKKNSAVGELSDRYVATASNAKGTREERVDAIAALLVLRHSPFLWDACPEDVKKDFRETARRLLPVMEGR